MKQNKIIITLLSVLILSVVVGILILNKKKKAPTGMPTPNGVGVTDTIPARAIYVDSLSDLLHFVEKAYMERKGMIDPKTRAFIQQPVLRLLDENKQPIPKVKAIL